MSPRLLPRALATLVGVGLIGGCAETAVPVTGIYHPTLIEVSPDQFLDGVTCADARGALRTYVATVYDVEFDQDGVAVPPPDDAGATPAGVGGAGDGAAGATSEPTGEPAAPMCPIDTITTPHDPTGFALPSSGPIDCVKPVAFARVIDGHRYRAQILGYDRNDLVSLAPPQAGGAPILVIKDTGERATPKWTWTCGDQCPETARSFSTRDISDCKLMEGSVPSGPAKINVALSTKKDAPACGSGPGQVDHFEVTFGGATMSGACSAAVTLTDVPTSGALSLPVLAYEAGHSEPSWGTTCTALPVAGLTVTAQCPILSDSGALDVDPAGALGVLSSDCAALGSMPGELELQRVDDQGYPVDQPRFVNATTCAAGVRFTELPRGPVQVLATLRSGGVELGRALCEASVIPGQATSARCSPEP
jgi:hypothetical protein